MTELDDRYDEWMDGCMNGLGWANCENGMGLLQGDNKLHRGRLKGKTMKINVNITRQLHVYIVVIVIVIVTISSIASTKTLTHSVTWLVHCLLGKWYYSPSCRIPILL